MNTLINISFVSVVAVIAVIAWPITLAYLAYRITFHYALKRIKRNKRNALEIHLSKVEGYNSPYQGDAVSIMYGISAAKRNEILLASSK